MAIRKVIGEGHVFELLGAQFCISLILTIVNVLIVGWGPFYGQPKPEVIAFYYAAASSLILFFYFIKVAFLDDVFIDEEADS